MSNQETRKGLAGKVVVAVIVLAVLAGVGFGVKSKLYKPEEGVKHFTITIESERDDFAETIECSSDLENLGQYVRTMEQCVWEESADGTYITGWYEMDQDLDNQYWWQICVDGELAGDGADATVLSEGCDYEFTLVQGW